MGCIHAGSWFCNDVSHCLVFGRSWRSEVLNGWKRANIIPIYRKDKVEDPENTEQSLLIQALGKL